MTQSISERLILLHQRIAASEREYARVTGAVQLLAVSKTQAADKVREAVAAGQRVFAENYLQEALEKMQALADEALTWHFIGPIQSNKTRQIAAHFHWVHTIDRLKIARRLSEQRPADLPPLHVLLQVNLSQESSKAGVALDELPALAASVNALPGLRLRGLMAIPAPETGFIAQRAVFRQLARARDALVEAGFADCTELSMGMSQDFEAAIAEGATMIRIGTDIFGPRS